MGEVTRLLRWVGKVQVGMVALSVFLFYTVSLIASPLSPLNVRGVGLSALVGLAFGFLWTALLLTAELLRKR